jgi:hypothetical protein
MATVDSVVKSIVVVTATDDVVDDDDDGDDDTNADRLLFPTVDVVNVAAVDGRLEAAKTVANVGFAVGDNPSVATTVEVAVTLKPVPLTDVTSTAKAEAVTLPTSDNRCIGWDSCKRHRSWISFLYRSRRHDNDESFRRSLIQ